MVRPSARSRLSLQRCLSGKYRAVPLFGFWNELLGRDRRLTRNFKIACGDRNFKLVEVRPSYQEDADRLARFARRQETYRSVFDTGHLPALVHCDDISMIVEWCGGPTLFEAPLGPDDMDSLADCLVQTYRRMPEVPNHMTRHRLDMLTKELVDDGLVPPLIHDAVMQELETLDVPAKIRNGEAFGDVSLPNFVRSKDGTIVYIDTMGVVDREPMMINLEKMAANLPSALSEILFDRVESAIGGVQACRRWSTLARTLQVVRSKSRTGAVADNGARQQKAHRAVADLERHLQQKTA
jgi:hypothetical protein